MENNNMNNLRHSCSHLLAAAVLEYYPNAKLTIGPPIEDGFYYDIDFGDTQLAETDLLKIEQKMHELVKSWDTFEKIEISKDEALKKYEENEYKKELINEFSEEGKKLTFYKVGEFTDLCKGGHVEHPSNELKHFKLLSIAGAYWRGNEKNKMLTRIYGTCFPTKEELDKYLWQMEEAKKRDHKKLGPQLDFFHFQSEAPGMPFWHPNGMSLRNALFQFSREIQGRYGYKEVQAPNLLEVEIFKKSGHWDHYKDNMFFAEGWGKKQYALRPMDCPGTIQIYKFKPRSHHDLPLRLSEYGTVTRNEKSGELNGLFRVSQITQDDAHIFVTPDQIQQIVVETMKLAKEIYDTFGIPFKIYLSTRPDDYMGELEIWDKAEKNLKSAIQEQGLPLLLKEKDGAFYGPKIDYQLEDSLGRTWQCGTIQLDFQMPQVFDLNYIGEDGKEHRPVILHRTIMGSIERFIGILMEHCSANLPLWLSPEQVRIIPISERHESYAEEIAKQIVTHGIHVSVDKKSESMQKKIRNAQQQKVYSMIIVGDKELQNSVVSIRDRKGNVSEKKIEEFIKEMKKKIDEKSTD